MPHAIEAPSGLLVEITSRCNLTCKMCPLTAGDTPSSHDPGHMAADHWPDILAFAREAGRVNVGGYGEPLSNPKALSYLRDLDAAGVRICMTTNATMVNEKVAAALGEIRHLENINVSVDSPDPAQYEAIRGGPLPRALDGVRSLARALGPSRLTVSSVMMRSNVASLAAFPALLASMGVRKYVLQGLVDYTPGLDDEEFRAEDALRESVERIREAARAADVELVFELPERTTKHLRDEPVAPPTARAETDTKQCFAPWDEPVVDKDGRVFPCCYAMTHGRPVLGNLTQQSFDAIWHGRMFTGFRRAIVDGRSTPGICRQCTVVPSGPHLYREFSAEVVPEASRLTGASPLTLVMRNTGAATWRPSDQIHIGTAGPRDRPSPRHHVSWLGPNRIGTFREAEVAPGAVATFEFRAAPHAEIEAFQLVVEHRGWLPGTRFEVGPTEPEPEAGSRLRSMFRRIGVSR